MSRPCVAAEVAELEQTRAAREAYLARHPEVPRRLAELDGAIARGQELDRLRRLVLL
jgi:anti-sigma factor RsiW